MWTLGSFEKPKFSLETLHRHNVFDVSFVPQSNDSKCISCSADGKARAFFYLSKGGETKKTDKQGVVQLGNFETGSSQLVIRGTHESFKCRFFPESASTVFTTWSHGTITRSDLRDGVRSSLPFLLSFPVAVIGSAFMSSLFFFSFFNNSPAFVSTE